MIRGFFGMGSGGCASPAKLDGDMYAQGLLDLRDKMLLPTGRWSTFYVSGADHTALQYDDFYTVKVGDKLLTDWVAGIINGGVPAPVGP